MPNTKKPRIPLIHPRYKMFALACFLCVLYISSASTWVVLQTFEAYILSTSDRLAGIMLNKPIVRDRNIDASKLVVRTEDPMTILLTAPGHRRAGETLDGIRYTQLAETTTMIRDILRETRGSSSEKVAQEWSLEARKPPIGTYTLTLESKKAGSYSYEVTVLDRAGFYDRKLKATVELEPYVPVVHQIRYHKDLVGRARIIQSKPLRDRLRSLDLFVK